jgi:hypothetical protein
VSGTAAVSMVVGGMVAVGVAGGMVAVGIVAVGGLIGSIDTGLRVCYISGTNETFTFDDTVILDLAEGTLEDG